MYILKLLRLIAIQIFRIIAIGARGGDGEYKRGGHATASTSTAPKKQRRRRKPKAKPQVASEAKSSLRDDTTESEWHHSPWFVVMEGSFGVEG